MSDAVYFATEEYLSFQDGYRAIIINGDRLRHFLLKPDEWLLSPLVIFPTKSIYRELKVSYSAWRNRWAR